MELKKRETDIWNGTYKGVGFEINNWKIPPNSIEPEGRDCWTYYLIIHLDRIPEDCDPKSFWLKGRKKRNRVLYDYYNHDLINNLDWHGGLTWYSKESGFDGSSKIIKIGCDYAHLWDENFYYDLDIVSNELKNTIERFLFHIPDYKYWCCGNGKLYSLSEGKIRGDTFYSSEYYGDKDWFKELTINQTEQTDENGNH